MSELERPSLTKSQKIEISTTEVAKRMRKELKEAFPNCKFSVRSKYYSMGSSISVSLMKADRQIKKAFNEITENAFWDYKNRNYTKDRLKEMQEENYHQVSEYGLRAEIYRTDVWNNGVFLTAKGHSLLQKVIRIADYYNYDDSDSQIDYYSVHFAFHLQLGKWDKPFVDGV